MEMKEGAPRGDDLRNDDPLQCDNGVIRWGLRYEMDSIEVTVHIASSHVNA